LSNFRTSSDEFEEDVEEVKDDDEDSSDSIMEVETESEVEMRCPTYLTFLALSSKLLVKSLFIIL